MEIGPCHRPISAARCPRPLRAHRRTKNVPAFHFSRVTLRLPPAASRDRGSRGTSHERSLLTCLPSQERSTGPSHRRPGFRLSPSPAAIDTRCSARRYNRNTPQNSLRRHVRHRNPLKGSIPSPRPVIGALHPQEARACQYDVPGSRSRRHARMGAGLPRLRALRGHATLCINAIVQHCSFRVPPARSRPAAPSSSRHSTSASSEPPPEEARVV